MVLLLVKLQVIKLVVNYRKYCIIIYYAIILQPHISRHYTRNYYYNFQIAAIAVHSFPGRLSPSLVDRVTFEVSR